MMVFSPPTSLPHVFPRSLYHLHTALPLWNPQLSSCPLSFPLLVPPFPSSVIPQLFLSSSSDVQNFRGLWELIRWQNLEDGSAPVWSRAHCDTSLLHIAAINVNMLRKHPSTSICRATRSTFGRSGTTYDTRIKLSFHFPLLIWLPWLAVVYSPPPSVVPFHLSVLWKDHETCVSMTNHYVNLRSLISWDWIYHGAV